jgi:hypothetical protein
MKELFGHKQFQVIKLRTRVNEMVRKREETSNFQVNRYFRHRLVLA